eukprot:m.138699 g.138699  ORF g.138699 m.138699 type:complete len:377 (+) comp14005_c0_seq1:3220-4350(+)
MRSVAIGLMVMAVASAKKPDMNKKAHESVQKLLHAQQAELAGGLFTFGTLDNEIEGWKEAAQKGKEENQRIEDMKDSIGEETFDMINEQLAGMNRQGMEKQRVENRDGSTEAVISRVDPFAIDKTTVTIEQFRKFAKDTGYKTEAETFQWSFVHEKCLSDKMVELVDHEEGLGRVKESPHWCGVYGAYWRRPEGPDSSIKGKGHYPAVHTSWNDAVAYCNWAGMRLPTEKEWEYAARGGLEDELYPWGEEPDDGNFSQLLNSWEGKFPKENPAYDGHVCAGPSDAYQPNAYGLYNMVGNVWEWVGGGTPEKRILRGGSYVDTIDGSANHLLRVSTRMENSADSGGHNTGFRCARTIQKTKKKKQKKHKTQRRRTDL